MSSSSSMIDFPFSSLKMQPMFFDSDLGLAYSDTQKVLKAPVILISDGSPKPVSNENTSPDESSLIVNERSEGVVEKQVLDESADLTLALMAINGGLSVQYNLVEGEAKGMFQSKTAEQNNSFTVVQTCIRTVGATSVNTSKLLRRIAKKDKKDLNSQLEDVTKAKTFIKTEGSKFVRRLIKGGYAYRTITFTSHDEEYLMQIKASLKGKLATTGTLKIEFDAQFSMTKKVDKSKLHVEIETTACGGDPTIFKSCTDITTALQQMEEWKQSVVFKDRPWTTLDATKLTSDNDETQKQQNVEKKEEDDARKDRNDVIKRKYEADVEAEPEVSKGMTPPPTYEKAPKVKKLCHKTKHQVMYDLLEQDKEGNAEIPANAVVVSVELADINSNYLPEEPTWTDEQLEQYRGHVQDAKDEQWKLHKQKVQTAVLLEQAREAMSKDKVPLARIGDTFVKVDKQHRELIEDYFLKCETDVTTYLELGPFKKAQLSVMALDSDVLDNATNDDTVGDAVGEKTLLSGGSQSVSPKNDIAEHHRSLPPTPTPTPTPTTPTTTTTTNNTNNQQQQEKDAKIKDLKKMLDFLGVKKETPKADVMEHIRKQPYVRAPEIEIEFKRLYNISPNEVYYNLTGQKGHGLKVKMYRTAENQQKDAVAADADSRTPQDEENSPDEKTVKLDKSKKKPSDLTLEKVDQWVRWNGLWCSTLRDTKQDTNPATKGGPFGPPECVEIWDNKKPAGTIKTAEEDAPGRKKLAEDLEINAAEIDVSDPASGRKNPAEDSEIEVNEATKIATVPIKGWSCLEGAPRLGTNAIVELALAHRNDKMWEKLPTLLQTKYHGRELLNKTSTSTDSNDSLEEESKKKEKKQDADEIKSSSFATSQLDFKNQGVEYVGDFTHGKRHGHGKLTFCNGAVFDGTWSNDEPNGKGSFTTSDGIILKGVWSQSTMRFGNDPTVAATTFKGKMTIPTIDDEDELKDVVMKFPSDDVKFWNDALVPPVAKEIKEKYVSKAFVPILCIENEKYQEVIIKYMAKLPPTWPKVWYGFNIAHRSEFLQSVTVSDFENTVDFVRKVYHETCDTSTEAESENNKEKKTPTSWKDMYWEMNIGEGFTVDNITKIMHEATRLSKGNAPLDTAGKGILKKVNDLIDTVKTATYTGFYNMRGRHDGTATFRTTENDANPDKSSWTDDTNDSIAFDLIQTLKCELRECKKEKKDLEEKNESLNGDLAKEKKDRKTGAQKNEQYGKERETEAAQKKDLENENRNLTEDLAKEKKERDILVKENERQEKEKQVQGTNGEIMTNVHYQIINKKLDANLCYTSQFYDDDGYKRYAQTTAHNKDNSDSFAWKLVPLGDGYYSLINKKLEKDGVANLCWASEHPYGNKDKYYAQVTLHNMQNDEDDISWKLAPLGHGYYSLINKKLEKDGVANLCYTTKGPEDDKNKHYAQVTLHNRDNFANSPDTIAWKFIRA